MLWYSRLQAVNELTRELKVIAVVHVAAVSVKSHAAAGILVH